MNSLFDKIMGDTYLSYPEKMQLSNELLKLPNSMLNSISSSMATVGGAGIGFLIAKYLLGMGKTSSIVLALASGLLSRNLYNNSIATPVRPGILTPNSIFNQQLYS